MGKRISKSRGLNSQPRLKLKRKSTGSQPRTLEANANQPHPEALTDQNFEEKIDKYETIQPEIINPDLKNEVNEKSEELTTEKNEQQEIKHEDQDNFDLKDQDLNNQDTIALVNNDEAANTNEAQPTNQETVVELQQLNGPGTEQETLQNQISCEEQAEENNEVENINIQNEEQKIENDVITEKLSLQDDQKNDKQVRSQHNSSEFNNSTDQLAQQLKVKIKSPESEINLDELEEKGVNESEGSVSNCQSENLIEHPVPQHNQEAVDRNNPPAIEVTNLPL